MSLKLTTQKLVDQFVLKVKDSSTLLLGVLGAILTCSYLLNAVTAFDDLNFAAIFPAFVAQHGYLKTCWMLLSQMDMPFEYRTYGLSRLLQFLLWSIGGSHSYLYPLTIALTQVGTAIALLHLARERGIDEPVSLAMATIWLISPFSVNWCFHQYSYQILPFQIIIVTCWVLGRVTSSPYRYILASLLGFACALSGEMFLITGPLSLLLVAWASSDKCRLRLTLVAITAMILTLVVHRWVWVEFFQDVSAHQRYEVNMAAGAKVFASRTLMALVSIYKAIELQLREILASGYSWGIASGGLAGLIYWWISGRSPVARGPLQAGKSGIRGRIVSDINLAFLVIGLAISALLIILTTSILSGQVYEIMPRRYGYVSFTLLLLAPVILIAKLFDIAFGIKRIVLAIFVGVIASFAGQLHFGAIPNVRAADTSLTNLMKAAGGLNKDHAKTTKGVLFYVSANDQYQRGDANGATPGPKMAGQVGAELLESPFATYWTAVSYSINLLGFRFAGIPKSNVEGGSIMLGGESGSPSSNKLGKISPEDVVVVANLGFDPQDPLGRNVRVFKNYSEFQPYFFERRIKRDALASGNGFPDEFVVDLGLVQQTPLDNSGVMLDKKFSDPIGSMSQKWITNYGLLEGQDSVYIHPNISSALSYYRTNRNGVFTYGVSFNDAGMVEVNLDFWEQWRNLSGERVFEVEVSWDGVAWVSLGKIDLVSLNQNKPVSIVLTKRDPKVFQFRMKSVAGSLDVPVIQGLRIRKLPLS